MKNKWIIATKESNKDCARAKLMLERARVPFKEFRVSSPSEKRKIVEAIGDFKDYPQIYFMDEDFPVHIGGLLELEQYLALNNLADSKINFDELVECAEIGDLSCLEG